MSNTHIQANTLYEVQTICGDLLSPILLSTTLAVPVPASLTLPPFATRAFVRQGTPTRLVYVDQNAMPLTLAGSDGPYWLAIHHDTHTPVTDWTRQPGTHYLWRSSATQPNTPDGALIFASVTVAGGGVTALPPLTNPALNRVAYGGVGGQLSYAPQLYWDNTNNRLGIGTSSPATSLHVVGTAQLAQLGIGLPSQASVALVTAAGLPVIITHRLALGNNFTPAYPLDVQGQARITAQLGIGKVPDGTYSLDTAARINTTGIEVNGANWANARATVRYNRASEHGLTAVPSADTGTGTALLLVNMSGTQVGSITTTAAATAFNTSSDQRLKHAVEALSGALAAILALRPVAFRWNVDDSQDEGFLAHQLQQVIPHAVSGEPDAVDAQGNVLPQQVDHSKLVVWLCGAVQELAQRVTSLEEQLGI